MSVFRPVHVVHADAGGEYITKEIINFDYVVRISPYYAKNTKGKSEIFFQDQPQWRRIIVTEEYTSEGIYQLTEVKDGQGNV